MLMQGATKADQMGKGHTATLDKKAGDSLCAVSGLQRMAKMRPAHFSGEGENFLFTLDNGQVVSARTIASLVKKAAVILGIPPGAFSVISLRAGGASAMWDAGYSEAEIMSRGKWASDSWKIYVWNGQRRDGALAARLLATSVDLVAPTVHYNRRLEDRSRRM